ncbi:MAG: hypothetical protein HY016_03490 [Nitrosomonadales bacterium]|nr:hypothetical protein [Nitrosomonadales bacterium]
MRFAVVLIMMLISAASQADTNASVGYISGANKGIELSIGYDDTLGPFEFKLNYLDFVFHPSKADQHYQLQKISKTSSVCTDTSTGQATNMSNCYPLATIEYAPNAQLLFPIAPSTSIGGGYRGGDLPGPFAILQWKFYTKGYLAIGYGPDYSAAMFGLTY